MSKSEGRAKASAEPDLRGGLSRRRAGPAAPERQQGQEPSSLSSVQGAAQPRLPCCHGVSWREELWLGPPEAL